jgi:glycine oxidase
MWLQSKGKRRKSTAGTSLPKPGHPGGIPGVDRGALLKNGLRNDGRLLRIGWMGDRQLRCLLSCDRTCKMIFANLREMHGCHCRFATWIENARPTKNIAPRIQLLQMMTTRKNILIVGGGLAGCFAAAHAVMAGHAVTLCDALRPRAASRVAAGLFNVVTGREAAKSWLADEQLAAIHAFLDMPAYASLRTFFHFMPIYRPFQDGYTYNEWMVRLQDPDFAGFAKHQGSVEQEDVLTNPIGGLRILTCGWVEVGALCTAMVELLKQDYAMQYYVGEFDHVALDPASGIISQGEWAGIYDEVIFAEGMGIGANPWFQHIEIRPLKGQIADLKMAPGLNPDQIYLRKTFLIPKGNDFYTAGSTYELHFADDEVTPEGIETISDSVRQQVTLSFELSGMRAAIRPTTPNRRPILGRHPDHDRLVVFNGLGTKGVLQAPLMAQMLRDWLDGLTAALPKDVSADRFLKKNV